MHCIVWLIYTMAVAICVSLAFNIDTKKPHISTTDQKDFFANKVLRNKSIKNSGTLVTEPQQPNEEPCKSNLNQTHQCLIMPDISLTNKRTPVKHFGLSIAEDSSLSQFTVCSPSVVHECYDNSYVNSVCNKMTDHLQPKNITKQTVDLVFLIDGSGSMTEDEFNKNKDFILDIMTNLSSSSIKFAAVQFSSSPRKVFDFNDYLAGTALDKLMREPHMRTLTGTHRALKFVLEEIFENPEAGATPNATKVLVIITDGEPADADRHGIIRKYNEKDIKRFVIGVKNAPLDKFRLIASEPIDKNAFEIENYDGLAGILEDLINHISKLEALVEDLTTEMSQSGLSAVFHKVCSPSVVHECYDNSYVNSVCYKMTDHLQPKNITKQTVDLVFLIDGSGSMIGNEFNKNKDFIVDIMTNLSSSSIKFAAVQFSSSPRKVFDFNDYLAGTALDKLKREPQMKTLTNTHRALKFVLEEIFENPEAGATPNATKVLVIITDGNPADADRQGIIRKYDEKDIIRIVIGVRNVRLDTFRLIASEPKDKNAFKIENYDGLAGILGNFQKKIIKMEDHILKLEALVEDLTTEMSQSGLSAVFHKVCSPSVVHECYDNSYVNSVCYKMTDHLQPKNITKQTVDLVFLIDGSGSMTEDEFNKNKDFIADIMKNLSSSSIKFSAVQFSSSPRKVFDFNDYLAGTALDKLMREPHMETLTNTHKALKFVLEEIFENPEAGATPNATKVLVIITDGDPTDADRHGIIRKYNEKDIIRIVIGVGNAPLDKFRLFASEPIDKYVFEIENYDGLTGILEDLINHISKPEALVEDLTTEKSQSGLSAVFHKDTLILGSVGSNSRRRFLQDILEEKQKQLTRKDPDMELDYKEYSTSVGVKDSVRLYFTGAPRFGQVILFRHNCENWIAAQRINEEQPGSLFGAELCPVDINSDGNTDFLLVGAPLFSRPQGMREGHIYVYRLTDEMLLERVLDITAPSVGRFGTAIASLGDLNGDGLRDVAVGAPLEDYDSGAVYIFLGDKRSGIRSTFSQRIMGQKIKPELRFFGYTIDGDIDLGENGLPDIVVRSLGTTVVLRSRPVFNVKPRLSFQPERINTERIDCLGSTDENLPMVTLTVCFEMVETTNSKQGEASSGLIISYTLNVDPMKQTHRGFFSQIDEKAWNLTSTHTLSDKDTCFNHPIYMPKCVRDTVSPVTIRLNFFQVDSESASVVLNMDSKREAVVEVPFQEES